MSFQFNVIKKIIKETIQIERLVIKQTKTKEIMENEFNIVGKKFKMKFRNGKITEYKIFDQDINVIYYHKTEDDTTGFSMRNLVF
jgi:hypothetical protein